jgi:hypothetical protein
MSLANSSRLDEQIVLHTYQDVYTNSFLLSKVIK